MKDKSARALAIVALVFMGLFVAALVATLVDRNLLNGSIGYIALGCGVFVLMIFVALKADGRGYSITKMNNEIEMEKIQKQLDEQNREQAGNAENAETDENAEKSEAEASTETEDGSD